MALEYFGDFRENLTDFVDLQQFRSTIPLITPYDDDVLICLLEMKFLCCQNRKFFQLQDADAELRMLS